MIYEVWIIVYSLIVLLISMLSAIGGLCVIEIICKITNAVKDYIDTQRIRREKIAKKKRYNEFLMEQQKHLDTFIRKLAEEKQHKIDKEKWPLFFWKEDIK